MRNDLVRLLAVAAVSAAASCGGFTVRREKPVVRRETARMKVTSASCDFLRALDEALKSPTDGRPRSGWNISFKLDDCTERPKIDFRLATLGFVQPEERELVSWNTKCEGGISGPQAVADGEVRFHNVYIQEKNPQTLVFELFQSIKRFRAGKVESEVEAGCADVAGIATVTD